MSQPKTIFEHTRLLVNQKDVPDFVPLHAPPPTAFMPGTVGKIAVLAGRLERGQQLWADGDLYVDAIRKDVVTQLIAMGGVGCDE